MTDGNSSERSTVAQVFAHLLKAYGTTPAVWGGMLMTLVSEVTSKLFVPIAIAAWITAQFIEHQYASRRVVIIALLFLFVVASQYIGDHIFVRRSDVRYKFLVSGFYDNVMRKEADFFREQKGGVLGALFRDHLDGTINLFRLIRTGFIPFAATTVIPALALFAFDYRVAMIFCLAIGIRAYVPFLSNGKIAPLRRAAHQAYDELSGVVGDHMAHLPLVRASANYVENKSRIADLADHEGAAFWKRHRLSFQFDAVSNVLVGLCFTAIFFVLTLFSRHDNGAFQVAVISIIFVIQGMQAAQNIGDLLQRWFEHWEHVSASLAKVGGHAQPASKSDCWPRDGTIDLREIRFGYMRDGIEHGVFDGLNLSIPNGTHFAVVGENGAGKSTLVNLLMRFDHAQSGMISIGGCDLGDLHSAALYRCIGFVPQDPQFLNETIQQNVMFFEPSASPERLKTVFEISKLGEVIDKLPGGMEAVIGETGQQLSGGQRQRLAIARALLRDAPVYIFDEATNGIERNDAREIVASIQRFLPDRTFMFVTHSRELQDQFVHILEVESGRTRWLGDPPSAFLTLFDSSKKE